MKLAISNIGWDAAQDACAYEAMQKNGYSGLEIAPTRVFPNAPYEDLRKAAAWGRKLKEDYEFEIPSMQSIWYGRTERLFGPPKERERLLAYTKEAIDFAAAIGCRNLVFGCPKNRSIPEGADSYEAVVFFREVGDYAAERSTVIGMEANPPLYHTNYMNDTASALELVYEVDSKGFMLNLDVGTMVENKETVEMLAGKVSYINHVHISEPGLVPIETRTLHMELCRLLEEENYQGFVSIEMARVEAISVLEERMHYVRSVFG